MKVMSGMNWMARFRGSTMVNMKHKNPIKTLFFYFNSYINPMPDLKPKEEHQEVNMPKKSPLRSDQLPDQHRFTENIKPQKAQER